MIGFIFSVLITLYYISPLVLSEVSPSMALQFFNLNRLVYSYFGIEDYVAELGFGLLGIGLARYGSCILLGIINLISIPVVAKNLRRLSQVSP